MTDEKPSTSNIAKLNALLNRKRKVDRAAGGKTENRDASNKQKTDDDDVIIEESEIDKEIRMRREQLLEEKRKKAKEMLLRDARRVQDGGTLRQRGEANKEFLSRTIQSAVSSGRREDKKLDRNREHAGRREDEKPDRNREHAGRREDEKPDRNREHVGRREDAKPDRNREHVERRRSDRGTREGNSSTRRRSRSRSRERKSRRRSRLHNGWFGGATSADYAPPTPAGTKVMGNSSGRVEYETETEDEAQPSTSEVKPKRKRGKRKAQNASEEKGHSKKKVTKLDTAKYVYERLFLGGESSDVTVCAVGHMWQLHKLYLKQCKYFYALFREDSQWIERNDSIVRLEFPDGKVTVDALNAVLGSLYHNEIELDSNHIEGILSAASVLQLESVLDRSAELMCEELSDENVLRFLNCAVVYGLSPVLASASEYLKWNFWRLAEKKEFLADLPIEVLSKLICSSDTLIVEGEQDMYNLIKRWIYLANGGHPSDVDEEFNTGMKEFYAKEKDIYRRYIELWSGLRIHHLTTSMGSLKILELDGIIPKEILQAAVVDQWKSVLKNEEHPNLISDVTVDSFNLACHRLGRIVDQSPKCWRWTGFNNGVDIILNFSQSLLTLKRNCFSQSTPYSVNIQTERTIHYRIVITDMKGKKLVDTGRQNSTLRIDQSTVVARIQEEFTLPISVHLFYLAALPPPPAFLYVNQYKKLRERLQQQIETFQDAVEHVSSAESGTDVPSE